MPNSIFAAKLTFATAVTGRIMGSAATGDSMRHRCSSRLWLPEQGVEVYLTCSRRAGHRRDHRASGERWDATGEVPPDDPGIDLMEGRSGLTWQEDDGRLVFQATRQALKSP